jgi:hypothetical protein
MLDQKSRLGGSRRPPRPMLQQCSGKLRTRPASFTRRYHSSEPRIDDGAVPLPQTTRLPAYRCIIKSLIIASCRAHKEPIVDTFCPSTGQFKLVAGESLARNKTLAKRSTKTASPLFQRVLSQAERGLALHSEEAGNFQHKGLRGNARATPLGSFLSAHLPDVFAVGKGEARDYQDNVTGELDLFIYDRSTAAPIQTTGDTLIIPAEALYAVIEAKSVLSQEEIDTCLKAAMKVRALRPFKQQFIASPTDGRTVDDSFRCPYFIFAYASNLGPDGWVHKEYRRLVDRAEHVGCNVNVLDWAIVLDRGIIRPPSAVALLKEDAPSLFLEFYLHLMNFLTRERRRRPGIDWTAYTGRSKWTKLS